ncbi:MAG: methyltransferase [Planctomycetota bacterium]|nr:MAG: methyltransferase [Planctomycetota bacterium]
MLARWTLSLGLCAALACATPHAPDAAPAAPGAPSSLNANFLDPQLDVAEYVQRFEGESREVALARDAILAALDVRAGQRVADIGAGTGLFLAPLSEALGPRGLLYAVDLSPRFLEHLRERVRREELGNVRVVECTERSSSLPPDSIDVAFICDTYHHFEHPQETLASLHRALRPGGRLLLLDFERVPGVSRDWMLEHVRAGKLEFAGEVEAAGFSAATELNVPGLEENYLLSFTKLAP